MACGLRDVNENTLQISNCATNRGFGPRLEGTNQIQVQEEGVYKVAMGGDVIIGKNRLVTVALMDSNSNPLASSLASTSLADRDAEVEVPVGFITYKRFRSGDIARPTAFSAQRRSGSLLSGGYVSMEKLPGLHDEDCHTLLSLTITILR